MTMHGRADILLVEDEAGIRVLLEKVLGRAGHAVVGCASPQEALASEAGPFRLVILDYTMPGMDGLTLLGHLRQRQPDLPAILFSGLPMTAPELSPPVVFLQKPFRLAQLTEMVAAALGPINMKPERAVRTSE